MASVGEPVIWQNISIREMVSYCLPTRHYAPLRLDDIVIRYAGNGNIVIAITVIIREQPACLRLATDDRLNITMMT